MDQLGIWTVPLAVAAILLFCLFRRVPVFDAFTGGAKEGLRTAISILPTLVGLMTAVTMLSASGALDLLAQIVHPLADALGLPAGVVPLVLMKPVSGSGSNAILAQILQQYGPNSFTGRVASVLAGSTETALYCIAVYYGAVGIRKTRHTLPAALTGDLAACLAAPLAIRLVFHGV